MTQLPNSNKLFSVSQASKFLNVSIDTLRRWDKKGKLVPIRTAGGSRRYHLNQLEAFKVSGGTSPDLDQMLTIKEAAQKFGVSAITLRRWDKTGKIKFVRDESNYRRISISEIKKFLGENDEKVEKVRNNEKINEVEKVEKINDQVNLQVTRYLLYSFATLALAFFAVGIQLKTTPWGKELANSWLKTAQDLGKVNQTTSDQILGDEQSSSTPIYSLLPAAYSPNLLKNPSFETAPSSSGGPSAFWTLHPNSTDSNTQMSNHTAHSGGYSLLLNCEENNEQKTENNDCARGIIQESTKTEAGRSYQLGVWVKVNKGPALLRQQGRALSDTRIHLSLGPGYDKSFRLESNEEKVMSNDGWRYYSTTFNNPPPGLVPRIYIENNEQKAMSNEILFFLDDAVFREAESFAGVAEVGSKEYGTERNQLASAYSLLPTAYSSLLPSGGNILSISPQGIIYPTDSNQTQGGLGTDSSRFGKAWLSNVDLSQSLSVNEKIDIAGKLTANGNVTLGNNDGDELEVGARIISDLIPKTTNSISLGNTSLRWRQAYVDALTITNNATIGGSLTISGGLGISGGSGLSITGAASITGDLSLDGDLDFQGPQNITTTSDNLTISPTGNLVIDTSGGTVFVRDAAIDLTNQPTTVSANTLTLRSTGSFIIDTSAFNTDLRLQGGLGELRGDYGTIVLAARQSLTLDTSANNTNININTGSGTLNTSVGNYSLTANGESITVNGNISETVTGTITQTITGAVNRTVSNTITDRITGANNYVLRVGNSASDSDANGNDIFISAVDKITLNSSSFSQTTSGNTETIVSAGDYSVIVQGNNDLYLRGGGAGRNDITNGGDLQLSAEDSMILDAGDLTITSSKDSVSAIAIRSSRGGITLSTSSAGGNGNLSLYSAGTLTLDTSSKNSNIRLQTGSGTLTASLGTATISTENGPISLISHTSPINLITESTTNGSLILSSTGNLYLDTSRTGASIFLQGGLARVGSAGTVDNISGSGSLYVQNNLEVDGNVYLGTSTANSLSVSGYVTSNLVPDPGSTYNLGSNTRKWLNVWADTVTATNISGTIVGGSTTSADWNINSDNATADLEDSTVTFERGTEVVNSELRWNSSGKRYFSTNASFQISPDTGIGLPARPEQAIMVVNDSYGGRRLLTLREAGTDLLNVDSSGNILLSQASNIETSSGALTVRGYNGLTLTTSSATTGEIRVISRGTLQLDTSTNNTNILIRAGSGNLNVSSNQLYLTGNLVVTGTETFNGVTYTFPGADGSASNVLTTSGAGLLSWGTLGAGSITADSLDFSEFKDSMNL
ncbi:MerR family DNA-binding transcriptional regulator, partial [Candidatus Saganbacteria bacterium]|nr:MerR family DNA-binding transcriptional regulator [Candidatus Saganbacteria bacterium]